MEIKQYISWNKRAKRNVYKLGKLEPAEHTRLQPPTTVNETNNPAVNNQIIEHWKLLTSFNKLLELNLAALLTLYWHFITRFFLLLLLQEWKEFQAYRRSGVIDILYNIQELHRSEFHLSEIKLFDN